MSTETTSNTTAEQVPFLIEIGEIRCGLSSAIGWAITGDAYFNAFLGGEYAIHAHASPFDPCYAETLFVLHKDIPKEDIDKIILEGEHCSLVDYRTGVGPMVISGDVDRGWTSTVRKYKESNNIASAEPILLSAELAKNAYVVQTLNDPYCVYIIPEIPMLETSHKLSGIVLASPSSRFVQKVVRGKAYEAIGTHQHYQRFL